MPTAGFETSWPKTWKEANQRYQEFRADPLIQRWSNWQSRAEVEKRLRELLPPDQIKFRMKPDFGNDDPDVDYYGTMSQGIWGNLNILRDNLGDYYKNDPELYSDTIVACEPDQSNPSFDIASFDIEEIDFDAGREYYLGPDPTDPENPLPYLQAHKEFGIGCDLRMIMHIVRDMEHDTESKKRKRDQIGAFTKHFVFNPRRRQTLTEENVKARIQELENNPFLRHWLSWENHESVGRRLSEIMLESEDPWGLSNHVWDTIVDKKKEITRMKEWDWDNNWFVAKCQKHLTSYSNRVCKTPSYVYIEPEPNHIDGNYFLHENTWLAEEFGWGYELRWDTAD